MKYKYYLRGLGIGILVTALILGIAGSQKKQLSDDEVRARARELGMVESTTLSNIANAVLDSKTEKETEVPLETQEEIKESQVETKEPTDTEPTDTTPTDTKPTDSTPKDTPPTIDTSVDSTEMITIIVKKGDSSVSVSKDLAAAGLVESASSFDKYLCSNGYDKSISVGTYHIPMGASEEDIAKVITGKKSFD